MQHHTCSVNTQEITGESTNSDHFSLIYWNVSVEFDPLMWSATSAMQILLHCSFGLIISEITGSNWIYL